MKTLIITILGISLISFSHAQSDTDPNSSNSLDNINYKPQGGDKSLELALNPFNSLGSTIELPTGFGIRFRKFTSESNAFRMGVNLTFSSIITITQQAVPASNLLELKNKGTFFGLSIRPGFEKHLLSSTRLSPYFGGEAIFGWHTSTVKSESQAGTAIQESISKNGSPVFLDGFTFGVGALAGVDFYIAKQLYLGLELNYSLKYTSVATEKFTDTSGNMTEFNNGSVFEISPEAFASIRIGYIF